MTSVCAADEGTPTTFVGRSVYGVKLNVNVSAGAFHLSMAYYAVAGA